MIIAWRGDYAGALDQAMALANAKGVSRAQGSGSTRKNLEAFGFAAYIEACGIAPYSWGVGSWLWARHIRKLAEVRVNAIGTGPGCRRARIVRVPPRNPTLLAQFVSGRSRRSDGKGIIVQQILRQSEIGHGHLASGGPWACRRFSRGAGRGRGQAKRLAQATCLKPQRGHRIQGTGSITVRELTNRSTSARWR